jgi:hypothetical protein
MTRIVLFVLMLLVPLELEATGNGSRSVQHLWLSCEFNEQVNQYVDLHHAVAASFGPEIVSANPADLFARKHAFATAIRAARPGASEGNIFTPEVASFFRARIAQAIRETGFDLASALQESAVELEEETSEEPQLIEVNGDFPWHAGAVMWPSILWKLPPLPPEVEYRFVAGDLVLIDLRAALVVDILRAALPAHESTAVAPIESGGD